MHAKRPLFCNIAPRVRELCGQRISAWRGSGIIELNICAFIGRLHNTDRKFVSHSSYCEKKIQFLLRLVRIEINICLTLETLHCNPPLWPIFVLISSMSTRNGTSSFLGKWVLLYQSVFGRSPADKKPEDCFLQYGNHIQNHLQTFDILIWKHRHISCCRLSLPKFFLLLLFGGEKQQREIRLC